MVRRSSCALIQVNSQCFGRHAKRPNRIDLQRSTLSVHSLSCGNRQQSVELRQLHLLCFFGLRPRARKSRIILHDVKLFEVLTKSFR
jgi:hypothetical protein